MAQRVASSFDVTGMSLAYADTVSSRAATFSPHVVSEWAAGMVEASGTYSEFMGSGRGFEGALNASRLVFAQHDIFGELSAFAGGSMHSEGSRTSELLANARVHVPVASGESFFGAGAGRTYDGFVSRSIVMAEAGASFSVQGAAGALTLVPTIVDGSSRYTDAQLSASWSRHKVELSGLAGARIGDQLPNPAIGPARKVWGSGTASFALTPGTAVLASGGIFPINPIQGFPGGRFVSVGIRLIDPVASIRRSRQSAPTTNADTSIPAASIVGAAGATPAPPQLTVAQETGDSVTLTISGITAERIEVTADFTSWDPVTLDHQQDNTWSATFFLPPGKYQMNVRVNGGQWIVPRDLLSMSDEFGGAVGLLVVERESKK